MSFARTLTNKFARALGLVKVADVLVEGHVALDHCDVIGPATFGFRSYANHSFFRHVSVGRYCSIGRGCSIGAALHDLHVITTHPVAQPSNFLNSVATTIGHDVWIGDGVTIISGVNVGTGSVIGAGAVITKDVPPYSIVVGVPGRVLRLRFPEFLVARLLESEWWRFGDSLIASPGEPAISTLERVERGEGRVLAENYKSWRPRR